MSKEDREKIFDLLGAEPCTFGFHKMTKEGLFTIESDCWWIAAISKWFTDQGKIVYPAKNTRGHWFIYEVKVVGFVGSYYCDYDFDETGKIIQEGPIGDGHTLLAAWIAAALSQYKEG